MSEQEQKMEVADLTDATTWIITVNFGGEDGR